MQAVLDPCRDPEVAATALKRPKEVRMAVLGRCDDLTLFAPALSTRAARRATRHLLTLGGEVSSAGRSRDFEEKGRADAGG